MKKFLKKLDKLWSSSDERLQGENPACDKVLSAIESKMNEMDDDEIVKQLSKLSNIQLSQILPVLEDMVDEHPKMKDYIAKAMN
ncbi:hypothetical protein [Anaerovorax sp. IOR16]|uniref:hypothetical protein n=1 Tax=Anaerovorax sp. IOR16 TaxID=2773458 RepID=UPI0019CFE7E6|nr:hypothetical protein [Anaerovorax sp. IOR16]